MDSGHAAVTDGANRLDHCETRRSSLLFGLVALLGATFMLCFGRTEALLIVARALQGISAAVVWTVGKRQTIGTSINWTVLHW